MCEREKVRERERGRGKEGEGGRKEGRERERVCEREHNSYAHISSLGSNVGMDCRPHILSHVAQELVCVMGMELSQERETACDKGWAIKWVSWLSTQQTPCVSVR